MANRKSTKKKIEKAVKKVKNPYLMLLFLVIFVGGCAGGYFLANHFTRNDTFEVIGEKTITLELGQTYEDEGAIAISFGKDVSSKIVAENNIDFTTAGQYYIKYTVEDIRYSGISRYRTIIIVEEVAGNE